MWDFKRFFQLNLSFLFPKSKKTGYCIIIHLYTTPSLKETFLFFTKQL